MKKQFITSIAIATILTAGAVKADEVKTEINEPQIEQTSSDFHVGNISATENGKNVSSGVIEEEYNKPFILDFVVTGWGDEIKDTGILVVETPSGAFIGTIGTDGHASVEINLTNEISDVQLLHVRTQGFATDAPMTITANMKHSEEVNPEPTPNPEEKDNGLIEIDPVEPEEKDNGLIEIEPTPEPEPEPEPETPVTPVTPKVEEVAPEVPESTVEEVKTQPEQVETEEVKEVETLPETGDSETLAVVMLGFLAVVLSIGLFLNKRKNKSL